MKKIFYLMAAFAALSSCTRAEGPDDSHPAVSQYEISFVNAASTKAYSENTATEIQADGFGVACVTSEGENIFIEKAEWNSEKSSYFPANGPWFYPSEGTVAFYGTYPSSQSLVFSEDGLYLSYVQNPSEDLLAVKKTGVVATATPVALSFDHILSLIRFSAVSDNDKAMYKIKSISISVPSAGVFVFGDYGWVPADEMKTEICFDGELEIDGPTEIPSATTMIPCNPEIRFVWDVYASDGTTLLASHDETRQLDEALEMGEECTVTMRFSGSEPQEMAVSIEVKPWTETDKELLFE